MEELCNRAGASSFKEISRQGVDEMNTSYEYEEKKYVGEEKGT